MSTARDRQRRRDELRRKDLQRRSELAGEASAAATEVESALSMPNGSTAKAKGSS